MKIKIKKLLKKKDKEVWKVTSHFSLEAWCMQQEMLRIELGRMIKEFNERANKK